MNNCIKLCAKFQDHGLDMWNNKTIIGTQFPKIYKR